MLKIKAEKKKAIRKELYSIIDSNTNIILDNRTHKLLDSIIRQFDIELIFKPSNYQESNSIGYEIANILLLDQLYRCMKKESSYSKETV